MKKISKSPEVFSLGTLRWVDDSELLLVVNENYYVEVISLYEHSEASIIMLEDLDSAKAYFNLRKIQAELSFSDEDTSEELKKIDFEISKLVNFEKTKKNLVDAGIYSSDNLAEDQRVPALDSLNKFRGIEDGNIERSD